MRLRDTRGKFVAAFLVPHPGLTQFLFLVFRGGDNRRKGPESKLDFPVTLEDLYTGSAKSFNVQRNIYCSKCKGSGAEGGKTKTCTKCKGQGTVKVIQDMGFMQM